jgi:DNA/RNA-binding protein KIN17
MFSNAYEDGSLKSMYKQKYYCQICNRQCRDRDGMTCHMKSLTHLKNMETVAQDPDKFIEKYSKEFEMSFVDIIKRNYNGIFVSANKIYADYLNDKDAVHLNATKWNTLSGFLKYLEGSGQVLIQVGESETKIKYVDKTYDSLLEKVQREKNQKEVLYEEKKKMRELQKIEKLKEIVEEEEKKKNTQNDIMPNASADVNKGDKIDLSNIKIEYKKPLVKNLNQIC